MVVKVLKMYVRTYPFYFPTDAKGSHYYEGFFTYFRPELFVHPPRVPTKRAFQRSLHESYQYMMKCLIDAQNQEAYKRKKLAQMDAIKKSMNNNDDGESLDIQNES